MDISTSTSAYSRSPLNPPRKTKYETLFQSWRTPQWRIEKNTKQLERLQKHINGSINGSYAFTNGKQLQDVKYKELFVDFFRKMRGGDHLINQSGWGLAKALCYDDTTRIENIWCDSGGIQHDEPSRTY